MGSGSLAAHGLCIIGLGAMDQSALVTRYAYYHLACEFWWPVTYVEMANERMKPIHGCD